MQRMIAVLLTMLFLAVCQAAQAAPVRVVLLDFSDNTAISGDTPTAVPLDREAFARKGILFLAKALLDAGGFELIDRRDLIAQLGEPRYTEGADPLPGSLFATQERPTSLRPDVLHAARTLGANTLLRGSLISFSSSHQRVNQSGYQADFLVLGLRVLIDVLDVADGRVVTMAEGKATRKFRQTPQLQTDLGEDELLDLYREAIVQAVPEISKGLASATPAPRGRARLSISTTADPALVELDGIMIGSTPIQGYAVDVGDHHLAVTKAGYQGVTKIIFVERDSHVTVPMISHSLDAQDRKEILEHGDLQILKVE